MSPLPSSGNEGYTNNRDIPFLLVTFDVVSILNPCPYTKRRNLNCFTRHGGANAGKPPIVNSKYNYINSRPTKV